MKEAVFIFSELLKEVMHTQTESPGLFPIRDLEAGGLQN